MFVTFFLNLNNKNLPQTSTNIIKPIDYFLKVFSTSCSTIINNNNQKLLKLSKKQLIKLL